MLVRSHPPGSCTETDVPVESAAGHLDQDGPIAGARREAGESLPGAQIVPTGHWLFDVHLRAAASVVFGAGERKLGRQQRLRAELESGVIIDAATAATTGTTGKDVDMRTGRSFLLLTYLPTLTQEGMWTHFAVAPLPIGHSKRCPCAYQLSTIN